MHHGSRAHCTKTTAHYVDGYWVTSVETQYAQSFRVQGNDTLILDMPLFYIITVFNIFTVPYNTGHNLSRR